MKRLRRWVKDVICVLGYGDLLTEYCEDCGIKQPLYWWAPNGLWQEVTGHATPEGDNAAGILCPTCFDLRAQRKGVLLRWTCTPASGR